jgi:hypothetical protein
MSQLRQVIRIATASMLAGLLLGCSAHSDSASANTSTQTNTDDPRVLKAVLEEFAASKDTFTSDKGVVLLFDTDSVAIPARDAELLLQHPGKNCPDLSRFRSSFLTRSTSVKLRPELPPGMAWRLATAEEAKSPTGLPPHLKPLIRASAPAYDARRESALVMLYFPWSIHAAQRTYVVAKRANSWHVVCNDSTYFL